MGAQGPAGATGAASTVPGPQGPAGSAGSTGPSGSTLLGAVTVSETLLVSLSLGTKRMTKALVGVMTTDKLLAVPNGLPTSGCEVVNAYPASAGNVSIGYIVPALGVGATYSIPVAVYRMN